MFNKILLATDGSDHSIRASEKAIALASCQKNGSIEVVYVIDGKHSKDNVLQHWGTDAATYRKKKLLLIEQKIKHAKINYTTHYLHGEPGPTIVKHANEHQFDAVVIGSRGLNTLQEMVLGSVSHKVAKRVKCPVMIVK